MHVYVKRVIPSTTILPVAVRAPGYASRTRARAAACNNARGQPRLARIYRRL